MLKEVFGSHKSNSVMNISAKIPFLCDIEALTHFFPPFQHLLSERLRLSDSKCWNLVAKTQRWEKMG